MAPAAQGGGTRRRAKPPLPDVLAPGLDLVFCGTAPGRASAQAGAYYANPGNSFWTALHAVGLTGRQLAPAEFGLLPGLGLGLTDLNKTEIGSDHELSRDGFDVGALRAKLRRFRPAAIAFTAKAAAAPVLGTASPAYGRQSVMLEGAVVFVLASPSGRARSYWTLDPWREAASFVRACRTSRRSAA
ncbi:MAG: mismatch-specific DNA-glycosylase [Alphaproteobacteria bacterium]|nr:mismatch-specific DNA-glycosylase [Alphaproteobacteria bacterium]